MSANIGNSAATHFGRQMRKERLAHGWSLRDFSARAGIDFTTASRIENGKRPPTEAAAAACDAVFPERRGWFSDWYDESRSWAEIPAGFRSWAEVEEGTSSLRDWWPSIVSGLLQTEDYAAALLRTFPGVSAETVSARLKSRIERQRRVLARDSPPSAWFIVDEMALYRRVGSAEVMAGQMRRLAEVASLPHVTMQVLPAVAHPANASGFMVADSGAAYTETVSGGYVLTDDQTITALARLFDTLRGECYKVSESAALFGRMAEVWTTGVSRATATPTGARASRLPRPGSSPSAIPPTVTA